MNPAPAVRARSTSSATASWGKARAVSRSAAESTDRVEVIAGVVRDEAGRILLAQRPPGKHLAGTWEFPGGKCEDGESDDRALAAS